MPEWVTHAPIAMPIELRGHRGDWCRARVERLLVSRVDIVAGDVKFRRNAAKRLRGLVVLRMLVGKHEQRAVDRQFGVADAAGAGFDEPVALLGAEDFFVELDRGGGV